MKHVILSRTLQNVQQKIELQQVNGAMLLCFGRGIKLLSSNQISVSEL